MDRLNIPLRLFFKKEGRAVYISHLDLNRCISRALVRSGLPVWYTQGFNPHLYITFTLPLSLGVAGLWESCDIKLTEEITSEKVMEKLNSVLPKGIEVLFADEPKMKPKDIMWADYDIILNCEGEKLEIAMNSLLKNEVINVEKKTKKKIKTMDIKPMFSILSVKISQQGAVIKARCRAGVETNLNPSLILEALKIYEDFEPFFTKIIRTNILTEKLSRFG